jgi:hypothetical protein
MNIIIAIRSRFENIGASCAKMRTSVRNRINALFANRAGSTPSTDTSSEQAARQVLARIVQMRNLLEGNYTSLNRRPDHVDRMCVQIACDVVSYLTDAQLQRITYSEVVGLFSLVMAAFWLSRRFPLATFDEADELWQRTQALISSIEQRQHELFPPPAARLLAQTYSHPHASLWRSQSAYAQSLNPLRQTQ